MMASSENQQHHPDPAPPSHPAGDFLTRDCYSAQDASRPPSQHEPYLTPYLGLRARLSQTWINRWTILLLLVLVRTLFAVATLDDNITTARKQALSACTSVENVGSAMASMPHYMSAGINELTAHGIEKAIDGLMEMLMLSITVVEELILSVINMLTDTYLCLITLAVSGSLHVAVSVAKDVGSFLNATVQDVGKDLGAAANDFQSAMNGFLSGISDIGDVFSGHDSSPPTINLSGEITRLDSLQLPPGYDQGLEKLNASIPDFAQVRNFTNRAISFPFEEIKKLLNESLPKYTMTGDLFPVPPKEQLQFCSDNNGITDFFDELVQIEQLAKKVFLVVIIIASILAMIPMGYHEIRQYRFAKNRARLISTDTSRDPMDSVYLVSRPYTSSAGLWLSKRFSSIRHATLVRWTVAYATTVPALFVLSLALAGLLASLCQYILLKTIQKEVPVLENQVVDFADKVIYQLNNASAQWAIGANTLIAEKNATINQDVFGWVNTSTTAINNTLNVFVDEMTNALNYTFGGTILYDPITEVFNCLIGLKIEAIERGLTWIHNHAHIDFPLLPNNTFSLGAIDKVSGSDVGLLSPGPDNGAANEISDAVYHVTALLEKAVRQEAIISLCLLIIWLVIALVGLIRAIFLCFKSGKDTIHPDIDKTQWMDPVPLEEYLLDQVSVSKVPTYEQATAASAPEAHRGNKYHGQAYTLTPTPLPRFTVDHATSPILSTGFSAPAEKLGNVGGRNVDSAIRRPIHIRASSHGDYAITSPLPPSTTNNNLLSTSTTQTLTIHPNDPFADPVG